MLNFVENLLENERGPMNDQDLTKTDYDPDRSLVLIEGLSHFLTNFLQNLASCQTSFRVAWLDFVLCAGKFEIGFLLGPDRIYIICC
jgi:hypothetical protein